MKKYITTFAFLLSAFLFSQTHIVPNEPGALVDFAPFFEKQQLKGYVQLQKAKSDDASQTYQYTVLDQDFKQLYQGNFTEKRKSMQPNLKYTYFKDGKLFLNVNEFSRGLYMNDRFLIVDTRSGNTSPMFFLKDGKPTEMKSGIEDLNYGMRVSPIADVGFLLSETLKKGAYGFYKNIILVDHSGKTVWQNETLPVESDSHFNEYNVMAADKQVVVALVSYYKNRKNLSDKLMILDASSGKKIALKPLSEGQYNLTFHEVKMDENFLYLVGNYYKKDNDAKELEYKLTNKLGLYRLKIDKKTGETLAENYLPFTDMQKFVEITPEGKIKKEGILYMRSVEIRPDGRNVIVAETYKPESFVSGPGFTELYTILLNPDFKIEKMNSFNMSYTAGSKFAYTQILPGNTGISSIFRNQEGRELTINEITYTDADSNFETRKLIVNKEDKEKYLVPAKPGYIGIRDNYFFTAKKLGKSADITLMKIDGK